MINKSIHLHYEVFASADELPAGDRQLLFAAREATAKAHAPYSRFRVGAAARLLNGSHVTGGNQENASFPAGLCAEGVVLAAASSAFPGVGIDTLAVSYVADDVPADVPIAPCGICRQSLQEFANRTGAPVRLILSGNVGEVFIVPDAAGLLPLAFTSNSLK